MDELTFRLQGVVKGEADFIGPLDLILSLLSKNKMEISDLRISELLDQYLEHMGQNELNLDEASEFTVMASHLIYLKSRMLLALGQDREDEDMALLLRALEERKSRDAYEKIKLAAAYLEPLSNIGRDIYSKPPEVLKRDTEYRRAHKPDELKRAMEELFDRIARRAPPEQASFSPIMRREPYPIKRKLELLLRRLEAAERLDMNALFGESVTRSEMVATFLAVLELCRLEKITVEVTNFSELTITKRAEQSPAS
ncbi:MAG: segregation/condensation protein A [Oscillospiraceae bacterium]|nr:segregation/condensation protein A [Oscillospiraceae bacterium]